MTPQHLFIGGPADGKWIAVEFPGMDYRVAEARPPAWRGAPTSEATLSFKIHTYTPRCFRIEGGDDWILFAPQDMPSHKVFQRLVDSYPQPKDQ